MQFYNKNEISNLEKWFSRNESNSSSNNQNVTTKSRLTNTFIKSYSPPTKTLVNNTVKSNSIPTPSSEQTAIVKAVQAGNNVIVDSVFGSGKTTTILQICQAIKTIPTLILTYNSRLKLETREKCQKMGLTHVETHSYHALTVKYYSDKGNTDTEIKRVVNQDVAIRNNTNNNNNNKNKNKNNKIGLLILDEQQDMTPLYHHLVKKFIKDQNLKNIQIVLLGDTYQTIYEYKGSDARFLGLADELFKSITTRHWVRLNITVSYRATHSVSNFINQYLLGYNRIKTVSGGEPIRYLVCDAFSDKSYQEIIGYLALGYKPEDIYILAPSLRAGKEKSPVRRLENRLVEDGIPCFVPVDDNDELSQAVTNGKIVFSTFHQIKGSERPVVLVFNIDESYYTYYARDLSKVECPNPVYVALSRVSEMMSIIHHYENNYFPIMDRERLSTDPLVNYLPLKRLSYKKIVSNNEIECSVTELIRHLDMDTIEHLGEMYETKTLHPVGTNLDIPSMISTQDGYSENVSEINGIAIPMYFELQQRVGYCSVLEHLVRNSEKIPEPHRERVMVIRRQLSNNQIVQTNSELLSLEDLLYLANLYNSYVSGYTSKREQIQRYDWLNYETIRTSAKRLTKYIDQDAEYEKEISATILGRKIKGHLDIVKDNTIWELKCVNALDPIHFIQIIIYAWLYQTNYGKNAKLHVFNILSEEIVEITLKSELNEFIAYLIEKRYASKKITLSDGEFLETSLYIVSHNDSSTSVSTNKKSATKCLIFDDNDSD